MGVPSRIKDEIAHIGKPTTLTDLCNLAQSIDSRYWEIKHDKSSDKKSDKDKKKTNSRNNNSGNNNNSSGSNSGNQNTTPAPHNNQASGSNTTAQKSTPDLSDKFGKDGKLTPAEHQCHMDNNHCLFCGKGGHVAHECTQATASAAKAKGHTAK
ncbi:hypothetical protein JB92DRAFT_2742908, partial [Gautieria morchelliformis]